MYHLLRLVYVLRALKDYHREMNELNVDHLGIILDFCALWQNHGPSKEEDTRSQDHLQQFKAGLKEINTPYGHEEITSIKMISVPKEAPGQDSRTQGNASIMC